MKKIILTENINKEVAETKIEESKQEAKEKAVDNSKIKASFSRLKGEMVSFKTKDNNEIKLKYLSTKNIDVNPKFTENNKEVIYKDVEDGIDLKYELLDKKLKESFIINKRNNNYVFNFETKIGSLKPSYNEINKCLEFKKDDKIVCKMLPPFMIDNKGEESKKCSYEVESNEEGILSIKLVADAEWINSDDRELPVIIDPTFEVEPKCENFSVIYGEGSDEYEDVDEVFVGYKNENGVVKFYSFAVDIDITSLAGIMSNKDVYLEIPVNYNIMDNNDKLVVVINNYAFAAYRPEQLFKDNLLRLKLTDHFKNFTYVRVKICCSSDEYLTYIDNSYSYYESRTLKQGVYKASLQIRDSNGLEKAKVIIEPTKENSTYIDYDMGVSGITSINLQSCRYKHRIHDLSISSGLLTMDIDHIFDSKNNINKAYGQNWNLSICHSLSKETFDDKKVVTYIDGSGVKHIFLERWFYKDGKEKHYINRNEVTLSENNKLIYKHKNEEGKNVESLVEYELINDEGFKYISLSSMSNYDAKSREIKYYMQYKNFKKEVLKSWDYNYLQFIYLDRDGKPVYVNSSTVEMKGDRFVTHIGDTEKIVFLSNEPTPIDFERKTVTVFIGGNKTVTETKLVEIAFYENLDEGLYTTPELENLEYEKNQAKYNLDEIMSAYLRSLGHETAYLKHIQKIDFNEKDSNGYSAVKEDSLKLYQNFFQLENEFISACIQRTIAEKNEYFTSRNFNRKLKAQKDSANDYVVDPNGNIFVFNGYGQLICFSDKDENKIEIIFNDDSNIEEIKTNEEEIIFKYNDNKKLEMMRKNNGDTIRFTYFDNALTEIDNNGRKTTITYLNGLQVYSDINDEIIIDTQTANTLKVKKYVEPNVIDQNKEFQFFVDRILVQNDKYEYSNNFDATVITNRKTNEITKIDFDFCGEIIKKENLENITYANYYGQKLISLVEMKKNAKVVFEKESFTQTTNKYSLVRNAVENYATKTNAYCLKVDLNDVYDTLEDFNIITLSVSYIKSGETYSFKQTYIGKNNETIVLPFFVMGQVSNFTAAVETSVQTETEIQTYIKDISIVEIESGRLQEYDDKNRLWKIKTNEGKTTYLIFDDKLPIHVEFKDWNGKAITTDYLYDNEGNVVNSVDSEGNYEKYLYLDGTKKVEKQSFNLKDASLVRSEISEYDDANKTYIEKGSIKDSEGNYPEAKTTFYPGTDIVKTLKDFDGTITEYIMDQRTKKIVGMIKENDGIKNSISYVYNKDFLTSVKNNGTEIYYTYDGRKRVKTIRVKGYSYNLIENNYDDNKSVLGSDGKTYKNCSSIETYFNGKAVKTYTIYKKEGNLLRNEKTYDSEKYATRYYYGNDDLVTKIEVIKTGENSYIETNDFTYDVKNRISSCVKNVAEDDSVIENVKFSFSYNNDNCLATFNILFGEDYIQKTSYNYGTDKLLSKEIINDNYQINYEYDSLSRVNHQEVKNNNSVTICHSYFYLQQDGKTLDLVAEDNVKIINSNNEYLVENHKYKYDVNGRIVEINIDNKKIDYEYDGSGRLIKEFNELLGIECRYSYDVLGNIVSKDTFDYSNKNLIKSDGLIYSCDSKHLLVSVNGSAITYDTYGRITAYNGKNFVWNKDGSLKSILLNENESIEYAYNDKGIRNLKKLSNGETVRFTLDGNKILREQSDSYYIDYLYSTNGLFGFKYNGKTYLYEKNIFGDIIRIYNNEGEIVGEYLYDAFGNITIVTDINGIATINPFRYRGYFYDRDTDLYYLNYRYYDSKLGRFISPDDASFIKTDNIDGLNIYAYCNNDPINLFDPSGHAPLWLKVAGLICLGIGIVLCGAAIGVLTAGVGTATLVGSIAVGAAKGALIGAVIGTGVGAVAGGVGAMIGHEKFGSSEFWSDVCYGAMMGFGIGALVGAIVGGFNGANGWYETKALEFTNSGSSEVYLGKDPEYFKIAEANKGTSFHVSDDVWNATKNMKGVNMWKINKAFLKQQIKLGHKFVFTSFDFSGMYGMEIQYILAHNTIWGFLI